MPIDCYIADFVCFAHRLIVEADGSQHVDSAHDTARDAYLHQEGFTVLRFSNYDILTNDEGVGEMILGVLHGDEQAIEACSSRPLSPTPLPQGERGFDAGASAPHSPSGGEGLR